MTFNVQDCAFGADLGIVSDASSLHMPELKRHRRRSLADSQSASSSGTRFVQNLKLQP